MVQVRNVEAEAQGALQLSQGQEESSRVRPSGDRHDEAAAAEPALLQAGADGAREERFAAPFPLGGLGRLCPVCGTQHTYLSTAILPWGQTDHCRCLLG